MSPAEQLTLPPGCVEAVRSVDGFVDHLVEITLHQRILPIHDLVVDFGGQSHKAPRLNQAVETAKRCRCSLHLELEHLLIVERDRIAGELSQALWTMVAKGVRLLYLLCDTTFVDDMAAAGKLLGEIRVSGRAGERGVADAAGPNKSLGSLANREDFFRVSVLEIAQELHGCGAVAHDNGLRPSIERFAGDALFLAQSFLVFVNWALFSIVRVLFMCKVRGPCTEENCVCGKRLPWCLVVSRARNVFKRSVKIRPGCS